MTAARPRVPVSLRRYLLLGILVPVVTIVLVNALLLYRQALAAVNTAYDRTLLASAKSIGELLDTTGSGDSLQLQANVVYAALEPFAADSRSRMFYKVLGFKGELVSGFGDLPAWRGSIPAESNYAALVDFYNDRYENADVRVAVLLQPVAGAGGQGMATIQVAETLEVRHHLARQMLLHTLWQQGALVSVIAIVVIVVVQRATRPVRVLSETLRARPENDLTPIEAAGVAREIHPLIAATNQLMGRLQRLLDHQKRFVRDASHQLRTPLAVLKTQIQSAQRGDLPAPEALGEMAATVDQATRVANQMLALAKVEQLRQQGETSRVDLAPLLRTVALDLSPLVAEKALDFNIETQPASVRAHDWMLRELVRNLLHNAIKHSPAGGRLSVDLRRQDSVALLTVSDDGPGITEEMRTRLFQPFSADDPRSGSGLGLAICQEIVRALGGTIGVDNRPPDGKVAGLDAVVRLPLDQEPHA